MMRTLIGYLLVVAAMSMIAGCSRSSRVTSFGPITTGGLKPVDQVEPTAQSFASGRESLPQAMASANPQERQSLMRAIKDLPPARSR